MGKVLIIIGAVFILLGILISVLGKIPLLGKLPGDIIIQRKNFTIYIPIATSVLVSVILSIIAYLFVRK